MTKARRAGVFLTGILLILVGALLIAYPDVGYLVVEIILVAGLIIRGLKALIYYITLARFMVGGKSTLYKAVILLDFAFLTYSLDDIPRAYFLLYVIIIHAFTGFISVLRANESRKMGAKSWKFKFAQGIINLLIPVICAVFISNPDIAVVIYGMGLVVSGIGRMITAFRKTALVYVQ